MPPPPAPAPRPPPDNGSPRIRVWDLPTRLFHWLLAVAVVAQFATVWSGLMEWHMRSGYLVLSLLLFRLLWGVVGGRWSRFAAFAYRPAALLDYLRGRAHADHLVGHTPLSALSVFAMLALLVAQVLSGLFADDEISAAGPLTRFVSGATVGFASFWHVVPGKWILLGLVGLHLLAILYYTAVRRQRLVGPMLSGDKLLPSGATTAPSRDDAASRWLALVLFAACAAFAWWIASLRA